MAGTKVRYPTLMDLPHSVVIDLAGSLDHTALHNWRSLVENLEEFSQRDILRLKTHRELGGSPTKELLVQLDSLGWNIVDLCTLAKKAQVQIVVDVLVQFCCDAGLDPAPLNATPSTPSWKGAKSCSHRAGYPATITLPLHARNEAMRRYNLQPPDGGDLRPPDGGDLRPPDGGDLRPPSGSGLVAAECSPTTPPNKPPFATPPNKPSTATHSNKPSTTMPPNKPSTATPPNTPSTTMPTTGLSTLTHVGYKSLLEATGGLDETPHGSGGHKLGEGGFGEVFYCQLVISGRTTEAAVKVFRKREEEGSMFGSVNREQFTTEVSSLSRLCHPHLLSLLAYSRDGAHLCLVYSFLPRGSLDKYVTDTSTLPPPTRVGVAMGVASALNYLHTGVGGEQIVHRDVKSANVLLASDWTAKLGDFGVARIIPSEVTSLMTTTIVGTTIFMAPEYRTGTVTPAADVYALGVVLFELLTAQSALDRVTTATGEETDLVTYILDLEDDPGDIIVGPWNEGVWQEVWSVAERCLDHYDFKRPTSTEVYNHLSKL